MSEYSDIRGFNYTPSYAYILNDVMDLFDSEIIEKELGYAKSVGANSVRIMITMTSFQRNSEKFLADFNVLLSIAEKNNLSVMPVLFNRWTDYCYPVGQLDLSNILYDELSPEFVRYIDSFIREFKDDNRINMWDLCNEPFFPVIDDGSQMWEDIKEREAKFWEKCIAVARNVNPIKEITLGIGGYASEIPKRIYGLVDVISFHPYGGWDNGGFAEFVDTFIQVAKENKKPLICSETCQGSLDDNVRSQCIQHSLQALADKNIGWYVWTLCAGNMVSMSPTKTDGNAMPGDRGYFSFFMPDGTIRPKHSVIIDYINAKRSD